MLAIEFVRKYRITGEIINGPQPANKDGWEHIAFEITLSLRTPNGEIRDIVTPFGVGVGWDIPEFTGDGDLMPDKSVSEVIPHLADSLRSRERDFDDYLSDFIADVDALTVGQYRRYEQNWRGDVDQGRAVYAWLYSEAMVSDLETVIE